MFNDVLNKEVFKYFEIISSIPRMSGKEQKIADYLCDFASKRGLYCHRDDAQNVFIRKPASAGYENAESILLQGHTDMVCEARDGVSHDFTSDPLNLKRNGDILYAEGTTLGADDGVAVAIALALLDSDSLPHPALECLFTSSEEVGLDGMKAFDTSLIKSKRMINLDSADDGVATVSCAGGVRTDISLKYDKIKTPGDVAFYELSICGLAGGHSGEDIHLFRTNAIDAAAEALRFISDKSTVYLASAYGGNKDNAIPRECSIIFGAPKDAEIDEPYKKAASLIKAHLSDDDKDFKISLDSAPYENFVVSASDSQRIIDALSLLKSAPYEMSRGVPDIVETSYNLGILRINTEKTILTISSRSELSEQLDDIEIRFSALARLIGGKVSHYNRYPGWRHTKNSALQKLYADSYKKLFGNDPVITGIHAGLECGVISDKIPDMDIISLGPNIKNLHSPSETLSVSSLDKLYSLVCEILSKMK